MPTPDSGLHHEGSWLGCTTTLLSGFPYDEEDAYTDSRRTKIREAIKLGALPKGHSYTRSWIANLCSQQLKMKAILEELGWKCLIETPSGHPETPEKGEHSVNGGTCYIMWYEIPKEIK